MPQRKIDDINAIYLTNLTITFSPIDTLSHQLGSTEQHTPNIYSSPLQLFQDFNPFVSDTYHKTDIRQLLGLEFSKIEITSDFIYEKLYIHKAVLQVHSSFTFLNSVLLKQRVTNMINL